MYQDMMKQQQYSQFNPQLPSIPRRKNQGGSKATGTSLFPHTKQRPWKIGKQLNGSQSMPVLRPKVKEPRPLRLKAPKKEVRHSELRGHEKKLEELTKGIQKVFPNAIPMVTFVDECSRMLADFGFNRDNSLAVIGLSRDEVARPLLHLLSKKWGDPYVTHSLGAQCNVGREGLRQCVQHAPEAKSNNGRKKLVIFTSPNIACNQDSEVGLLYRANKSGVSHSNNELTKILQSFQRGNLNVVNKIDGSMLDMNDLEMSLLNAKLSKQCSMESNIFNQMNLQTITRLAGKAALADFEDLIYNTLDLNRVDVAIVSSIQIHGQYHENEESENILYDTEFVALQRGFVVQGGRKEMFRKNPNNVNLERSAFCDDDLEALEEAQEKKRKADLPSQLFQMI